PVNGAAGVGLGPAVGTAVGAVGGDGVWAATTPGRGATRSARSTANRSARALSGIDAPSSHEWGQPVERTRTREEAGSADACPGPGSLRTYYVGSTMYARFLPATAAMLQRCP